MCETTSISNVLDGSVLLEKSDPVYLSCIAAYLHIHACVEDAFLMKILMSPSQNEHLMWSLEKNGRNQNAPEIDYGLSIFT